MRRSMPKRPGLYRNYLKRPFDLVASGMVLLLVAPLLVLLAIVVKLDSRGPVFFSQRRVGRYGRVFTLWKFRTMIHRSRKVSGEIMGSDPEVTRSGRWMRRFKLDELPQLLHVVLGDMSLVGPRPCMEDNVRDFTEDGFARLEVRPGLTGLAQVNGNIYLTWPERWKLDRQYVENLTMAVDMKILWKTCLVLIFGERKYKGS